MFWVGRGVAVRQLVPVVFPLWLALISAPVRMPYAKGFAVLVHNRLSVQPPSHKSHSKAASSVQPENYPPSFPELYALLGARS